MSCNVCRNPREKYLVFFFFSTRITCKFYTGIPNEKKFQKILFGCWMTSRFHVFDTRSLPPYFSLDFCRQSCVVVFLVDGGPLIWKFREEKSGRNLRSRENSQKLAEKRPPHQQQEKKKARKEVVHRKTQRKAPPQVRSKPWRPPVPPLPSRIPSQVNPYIHSCCFGSLALSPGPSSLAATPRPTRRRDLATAAPPSFVLLGNDRTNHSKWKSEP